MLFTSVLLIICSTLIYMWFNKDRNYWKKRNVAQKGGVIWDFLLGNCSLAEVYKQVYEEYPQEPCVGMFIGSSRALLLRDLENVQAVLTGDFLSFHSRGIPHNKHDVLADNVLFIDEYNRWKIIRQKISPVFTSAKLKNMFYIMERCARDFVDHVKENNIMSDRPFDGLYTYTTASIGASIFGIDTKTENTMDSPFLSMSYSAANPSLKVNLILMLANMFPSLLNKPKLFNLIDLRNFGAYEDFFVGVVKDVLHSRKNETNKRHDFIDICVELQKQGIMRDSAIGYELEPTDELLAAQAFFFFIAGTDTSANTMNFTLIELSYNPHILQRVHEEIDEVFSDCNEKVTYNEIEKLKYLEMVINEAIRKYPPIGAIQRKCTKDTVLPVGNVKVEKEDYIIIPLYAIHNDEKYYPNPETFDPERFAPENLSKLSKFSYLPFGEGNRICLGMRFARLQVKVGLAWLLRRYTLREQPAKPLRFERSAFSLRVSDACYELIPRNVQIN